MRDLNRLDLEMPIITTSHGSGSRNLLLTLLMICFPLPARLEQLAHLEAREGVCFGVEDHVAEGQEVVGREEEVEVFEGFGLVTESVSRLYDKQLW